MFKPKLKPITLAVMLAGIAPALLSAPVYADIQEKVSVVPGKSISPHEEAIISSAGTKVLRHIAQARADIHDKNSKSAKSQLDQAENLLNIIQASLPTTKVKDHIWVAKKHLEYENTQKVLPDLIPISTSLEELVDIMPVEAAKQHLAQAKTHLKAGNKQKAKEALEATDAALEYTEVDLPLSSTRQLVAKARTELAKKKLDDANKTLETAENSVIYMSFSVEQPLFAAKSLLWQTVLDLDAGHKDLAKTDLQGALDNLQAASQSDQKPTQEAARQLLAEAKQLQTEMNTNADVTAKIRHLWERTQAFTDRSMEYLAAGWARYRTETPFKSDLIEAKLHLANARIDLFTGHNASQAKQELASSRQYLKKAAEQSMQQSRYKTYTKQINEIEKVVNDLQADPATGKQAKYQSLQHQISGLIRTL